MMTTFNKPDITAPRYRKKTEGVGFSKILKQFKDKYPQYSDVSKDTFKKVIVTHNYNMREVILNSWEGVVLPTNLGHLVLGGCKVHKENVNVPESIKQGKRILHKNWETDGHVAKIYYSNWDSTYLLRNRELWMFEAAREFKRSAGKAYRDNWKNFFINGVFNVSKLYKKTIIAQKLKKLEVKVSDNYNEFNMI